MRLENFLLENEKKVLRRWLDGILESYPPQTATMLRKETNQFANPVGHAILTGMEGLLGEMLRKANPENMTLYLDKIIRIRAVQDFSPSQAVAFVFSLKEIAREAAADELRENRISWDDVLEFEARVDRLALLAFNVYMQCREKLFEVRVGEIKNRTHRLLMRANLIAELPGHETGSEQ